MSFAIGSPSSVPHVRITSQNRQDFKLISSLGLTVVAGGYGIMRSE